MSVCFECYGVPNFHFIGTVRSWYSFYVGCKRENVEDNLSVQIVEDKDHRRTTTKHERKTTAPNVGQAQLVVNME